jgi:hypothetical protein
MYVISILREVVLPNVIAHGTRNPDGRDFLFHSGIDGGPLAELRPDAVLKRRQEIGGVFDAKYKFLQSGPGREDLYQIGAYLMRFGQESAIPGFLVYPQPPDASEISDWERRNPWCIDEKHSVFLLTLPHSPSQAITKAKTLMKGLL